MSIFFYVESRKISKAKPDLLSFPPANITQIMGAELKIIGKNKAYA